MPDQGLTDTERLLWEQNRELRKLLREIAEEIRLYPFECSCLIFEKTCSCRAGSIDKWLNRPEVKAIMEGEEE